MEIDVDAKTDTALHQALSRALDFGKGLVHVLGPKSDRVVVFSTKRACPSCGRSFAELFPMQYTRKYHTTRADNMSTDWLGPRIYRPSLEEVLPIGRSAAAAK